jgi:uncharacterized protein YjbJ (UPF0337 family)
MEGAAKNLGSKIEEGVGRAAGDAKIQAEGMMNQAAGAAQDLYGQAVETAGDAAAMVGRQAVGFEKWLHETIETKPYTAVARGACGRVAHRTDGTILLSPNGRVYGQRAASFSSMSASSGRRGQAAGAIVMPSGLDVAAADDGWGTGWCALMRRPAPTAKVQRTRCNLRPPHRN